MERHGKRMSAVREMVRLMVVVVMIIMASSSVVEGGSPFESCYGECYSKCDVRNRKPLWCRALCLGKCKHGESIPDNLCNCTYTCSNILCPRVSSDPEKVKSCIFRCSNLCTIKY